MYVVATPPRDVNLRRPNVSEWQGILGRQLVGLL